MDETEPKSAGAGANGEAPHATHATAPIDLDQLTDRVYRLMQAELRQDRARREGAAPSGRR